jgi:hypothetical protein
MKNLKKSSTLLLSVFVGLIVSVLVYFIILLLPMFLSSTSIWTDIGAETMRGYALAGALIVFVVTARKVYSQLKNEWSSDSTPDT